MDENHHQDGHFSLCISYLALCLRRRATRESGSEKWFRKLSSFMQKRAKHSIKGIVRRLSQLVNATSKDRKTPKHHTIYSPSPDCFDIEKRFDVKSYFFFRLRVQVVLIIKGSMNTMYILKAPK